MLGKESKSRKSRRPRGGRSLLLFSVLSVSSVSSVIFLCSCLRAFVTSWFSSSAGASHQRDHFERRLGGAFAGVAVGSPCAVEGLLLGVGGQDAEDDGEGLRQRDLLDAPGGFAGDVIEVRRVAADDAAEADDRVELVRLCEHFRGDGELEGAGDPVGFDVRLVDPKLL